jgi:hypothetical protein
MNQPLTEKADRLRKKIKILLPEAQERDPDQKQTIFHSKDKYGNTLYGGTSLGIMASELVAAMELGEVSVPPYNERFVCLATDKPAGLGLDPCCFLRDSTDHK